MQWEKAYPLSEESKVLKREFRRTQYDFESANRSLKAAKDQYGQIVAAPFEWTVKNVGALFDQVFGLGWVKDEGLEAAERVRACEKEVRIAEAPFVAAKAKYDDIQARIQSLEDKRQELFHKSISVRSLISSCFVDLPDNIKSDVPVLDTKQKALACGVYRIEEAFSQLKMRWFGG